MIISGLNIIFGIMIIGSAFFATLFIVDENKAAANSDQFFDSPFL